MKQRSGRHAIGGYQLAYHYDLPLGDCTVTFAAGLLIFTRSFSPRVQTAGLDTQLCRRNSISWRAEGHGGGGRFPSRPGGRSPPNLDGGPPGPLSSWPSPGVWPITMSHVPVSSFVAVSS